MTNIIRVKKRENPFVMIDKTGLHDTRLSWKAKGLLAYLISLPDDWKIHERELAKHSKDGRDSTRAAMKELIENGYVARRQTRKAQEGEKGQFAEWETLVYEVPQKTETAAVGFSDRGKPGAGESEVGESDHTNKDFSNKDFTNKATTTPQENDSPVTNEEFKEVHDCYIKCGWGLPSPFVIENLIEDVKDYSKDVVIHAMKIAAERNAKSYSSYTKSIYREWTKQQLTTIEQVVAYETAKTEQHEADRRRNEFKNGKGGKRNASTQKPIDDSGHFDL